MATDRAAAAQQQLQARRARMCRTAAQMFRDRGYDATSVSDVARALGMTKAGLYHHFESKEALLFEIMMYGLDRVRDEVIVPVRDDPRSRGAPAPADRPARAHRHARPGRRSPISATRSARCRSSGRRQIEQRMRDLLRSDSRHAGRVEGGGTAARRRSDGGDLQPAGHDPVAAALVPPGRTARSGSRSRTRSPTSRSAACSRRRAARRAKLTVSRRRF